MKLANRSYFKKALVVFMAIVMVFTYMPSSMGVETAWADTPTIINDATAFADMESSGNYVLGKDITISESYSKGEFSGTFDGKGHTVTLNGTTNGVFVSTAASAVIQNLAVKGRVSGGQYIAGVVGTNAGTIKNCKNAANVTSNERWVGGIAGKTTGSISDCYNVGMIITTYVGNRGSVGGIAGESSNNIENCYNIGALNVGTLKNCGAIVGWHSGKTINNCYYLESSYDKGGNLYNSDNLDAIISKPAAEMKSPDFADSLGSAFMPKTGDYPALNWETLTASVSFDITPANAQLTITKTGAEESSVVYTGTGGTMALPAGEYSCTVSCEGYTSETRAVSVSDDNGTLTAVPNTVSVSLIKDDSKWGNVIFKVSGADDYEIKLTQNGVDVKPTSEENKYELLINKEYNYIVSSSEVGVEQAEGSITLTEDAKTKTEVVQLKKVESIEVKTQPEKTQYYVGDKTIDTTGLVITVTYKGGSTVDIRGGFEVSGLNTEAVSESQDIIVSYKGATTKYQISVKEKPFPSSVFNALADKAKVKYFISSGGTTESSDDAFSDATKLGAECLKSNIERKKNTSATVQIDFSELDRAYELSFDYILSAEGSSYDYIKINNEQIGTTNNEEWKTYALQVKKGDKVEIAYRKDYSGDKQDDCIYLKDFKLKSIPQVTFNTVPADALVSMKAADGTEAAASESADGKTVFAVQNGTYTYTVSAFGYKSESETITVGSEDIAKDITLTKLESHKATFSITLPDDLKGKESEISITVKSGDTIVKPEADGTYSLPQGEYTYTITHPNCETAEGNFTIADADVTESVTLTRKLVFSDFFDKFAGNLTATNDAAYPFKAVKGKSADGSDNCLESTNKSYNTRSDITIEAEKPIKLSFDAYYSAGSSSWGTTIYGLIVEKNGEQQLYRNGESTDWETLSIKCKSGDIVKIGYKDYDSYSYENRIRLKNFSVAPLYKLTFAGAPAGTTFVVKQGETVIEAEADGSYWLTNGNYTYTASAFGYEDADGSITVNDGDVSKTVTMKETKTYAVTFKIAKPSGITADAEVAVKSGNTVITADENGKYNLPADTYSYTITCTGCETETGEFTVDAEAKTVEVTLEKTLTFEDFFAELTGRAKIANDAQYAFTPMKEDTVKYLQSSNQKSGTESKITFAFTKPTRMSFDYMVSEAGSTSTDSNYGLKISKKETLLARYQEISSEWTSYEVFADAKDTITIAYSCYDNENSWGYIPDDNLIKLKNFKAEPLTKVSFSGLPENAKVSILSGEQAVETIDGKFLLEKGSYTYSVKAFGYKDIAGESLTVDGMKDTETETLTMIPTARVSVSFQTTPTDAAIVVKNEAGETMTAFKENTNSYSLPANEKYSYEVSASGYVSKSGYFTADTAKAIKVTLAAAGDAWNGTTTKEPTLKNGVYQISSAEELAWFAAKVNEDAAISGELTQNINLNNKEWTSFGKDTSGFAGTLDGHRYSIIGLFGKGGLLGCIAPNGKVTNLNVFGKISGTGYLGGIANKNNGTIENCSFSGTVTNTYASGSAAGIAGLATAGNIIKNCVSNAEIANTSGGINTALNLGGIAGCTYGTIENCYFTGSISSNPNKAGNKAIGGLVGELKSSALLKNSYTIGAVTGPEAGIGSVIGINSGTVENTYVLENICAKAIAEDKAQTGGVIQEKTAEEMRTGLFAYTLGDAYNQDNAADSINNGFPVLKWQGGTAPSVPQFEKDVQEALKAIGMKDLKRAEELEAEKSAVDAEIEAEGGLEALKELFGEDFEDGELTMEYIYKLYEINLDDDGTLQADSENKYQIKKEMRLLLSAASENGVKLSWTSSNEDLVNSTNGTVKLPTNEKTEVTLTVSAAKGGYTKSRNFTFVVWPENTEYADVLKAIKEKAERTGTFIQPLQLYNHTNIVQAMQQWIARQEYPTAGIDKDGIIVELLDPGTQTMPKDNTAYIGEDGTLTYFTGTQNGYGWKYALYDGVKFKLTYHGETTEVSIRAHIGWDTAYVEGLLEKAMERVTWDAIKGSNTNSATEKDADGWYRTVVEGGVTGDLILPYKLDKFTYASIRWEADDPNALYVTDNNDGTCTATLERPAIGAGDKEFTLKGIATFDFWDDYIIDELTSANGKADPAESFKLFDITIPENTTEQIDVIQAALEKYPTLLRDFSEKNKEVDTTAVTKDIQMVQPAGLAEAGIMTDRYNQKVTMTSSNTDVLEFYGYHAIVYRPLPGESAKTVSYTIRILDRRNNALLGEKTFEMTILPLTQKEIDDAAAWMNKMCTEEVYWNGIKGENTSKDKVTECLEPFEEILKNNGEAEYIRGAINITFGGIEVDDLPGYDSMKPQPWREFRSSKHSVVACENLLITQPEYNTKVKIDSVLSYGEFSKYWVKFGADEKYKNFEQFYKRPVAVTVTIIGTKGVPDPTPQPTTISVTVSVDGKGTKGFATTKNIKVAGLDPDTSTAWDAVTQALKTAGYKHSGVGDYIASVTDPKGITLSDSDTSKTGWLYTVNGKLPNVYLGSYYLLNNDNIVLYYTPDYTTEPGIGGWIGEEDNKDVVTNGKPGEAVTESKTEVTVTEKTNADGTKENVAEVKVSAENQKEILKQAKANKSKEIILNVSKDAVKDATKADVTLDKSFIDSIVKDTDAKLTIKTPFGDKTYTQEELKALSEAAVGQTITVAIEKAEEPADEAANIAKAKSIVKDMKLVARSSKTAKKNVKAVLKSDAKVKASIKELKDLGFTVKYRFYRSTKKSASYKSTVTKNTAVYTNTSGKMGTKYFYKVQVRVYDENGKLIAKTALKQCKYAARTWSK